MNVLGTHGEELDVRMIWLLFSVEEEAERDAGNNVMTGCLVEAYSRYKHTVTSLRALYLNNTSYQQVIQENEVKALACKCHGNSPGVS